MEAKVVRGFYGSLHTPCDVLVYDGWYCVRGSQMVNHTWDDIEDDVDVEELADNDCFTYDEINSLKELVDAVDS